MPTSSNQLEDLQANVMDAAAAVETLEEALEGRGFEKALQSIRGALDCAESCEVISDFTASIGTARAELNQLVKTIGSVDDETRGAVRALRRELNQLTTEEVQP